MEEYRWNAPYQVVERALASLYGADDAVRRGAFRARLDNLKRAKVLGVNPGKGQRNAYGPEEIKKLLVALELEEFGVTPAIIAKLFTERWESLSDIISRAAHKTRRDDQDIVLWIYPQLLSARWRGENELPEIGKVPSRKAMEGFYDWLQAKKPDAMTVSSRRACVFDLSSRLRAFDKALTATSMPEPPPPPSASGEQPSQRRRSQRG
jgi:hypothetical protein